MPDLVAVAADSAHEVSSNAASNYVALGLSGTPTANARSGCEVEATGLDHLVYSVVLEATSHRCPPQELRALEYATTHALASFLEPAQDVKKRHEVGESIVD